ncbi:MAG TPA: hypothetical protein VK983_04695 [Candidatus Limnocylindrales bacterium]|nr:hypothetical protein [Candidatus Limnocylindrales bacterium]
MRFNTMHLDQQKVLSWFIGFSVGVIALILAMVMTDLPLVGVILTAILASYVASGIFKVVKAAPRSQWIIGAAGASLGLLISIWIVMTAEEPLPWWSVIVITAPFLVVGWTFSGLLIRKRQTRQPSAARRRIPAKNCHIGEEELDSIRHVLTVDPGDPQRSETSIGFVGKWRWTRALYNMWLPCLVTVLMFWTAARNPGWEFMVELVTTAGPRWLWALAFVVFGIWFWIRRKRLIERISFTKLLGLGAVVSLWGFLGRPGYDTIREGFTSDGSRAIWFYLGCIAAAWAWLNWADWRWGYIVKTDKRVMILRKGPIWLPDKHKEIFIQDIITCEAVESQGGMFIGEAGVSIDGAGTEDAVFHEMYPMEYGQHAELAQEVNFSK